MKKILYLMHVHWGWIKQRPHFIAENLAAEYDVTVCFRKTYHSRSAIPVFSESKIELKELFVLPFSRFKPILLINYWLIKKQLPDNLNKFDIVWITHPDMYDAIKNYINRATYIVYDCMDDVLEFPGVAFNLPLRQSLANNELHLIKRSNTIFATSHYLKEKLLQRYELDKSIHVINNAINMYKENDDNGQIISPETAKIFVQNETIKIVYIGTISEWFDFDLIQNSLDKFTNITYILIGPAGVTIPKHERIIYHPPVEHKSIFRIMELADVLVMPFQINELILSVNPVKLYEYILAAKPVIASRYPETEKFNEYVYLYNSASEYIKLIEYVSTGNLKSKKTLEECLCFARENTWERRIKQMTSIFQ